MKEKRQNDDSRNRTFVHVIIPSEGRERSCIPCCHLLIPLFLFEITLSDLSSLTSGQRWQMWIESTCPQCLEVFFVSTSIPTTRPQHSKVERERPSLIYKFAILCPFQCGRREDKYYSNHLVFNVNHILKFWVKTSLIKMSFSHHSLMFYPGSHHSQDFTTL